jgi:hypothetical protein
LGCLLGLGLGGGVGDPHTENPPICEAEQEKIFILIFIFLFFCSFVVVY